MADAVIYAGRWDERAGLVDAAAVAPARRDDVARVRPGGRRRRRAPARAAHRRRHRAGAVRGRAARLLLQPRRGGDGRAAGRKAPAPPAAGAAEGRRGRPRRDRRPGRAVRRPRGPRPRAPARAARRRARVRRSGGGRAALRADPGAARVPAEPRPDGHVAAGPRPLSNMRPRARSAALVLCHRQHRSAPAGGDPRSEPESELGRRGTRQPGPAGAVTPDMDTKNGFLATIGAGSALTVATIVGGLLAATVLGFHAWPGGGAPDAA